jgi:hypothetical protein
VAWFDDAPHLLQREIDALEEAGIAFTIDEDLKTKRGLLQITARIEVEGQEHDFVATYPDEFPYFKPFVTGPDLGYRHHVNPTTQEYCLLEAGGGAWKVTDTLAWLLSSQVEQVANLNRPSPATTSPEHEVAQAEPFSAYLPSKKLDEMIVVDSSLATNEGRFGSADLAYTSGIDERTPLRGHVYLLRDAEGKPISGPVAAPTREERFARFGDVRIPWVQLTEQPEGSDARSWWSSAIAVAPEIEQLAQAVPGKRYNLQAQTNQMVLVGFPEETGHRTLGQGWVVLARERAKLRKPWTPPRFIRVERAGHGDLFTREPRLATMQQASVALIGLGGLGSHLVPLLGCMAPHKLYVIDGDHAIAANAIRNPGAFALSGHAKAEGAMQMVHATQPYTQISAFVQQVGFPRVFDATRRELEPHPSLRDIVKDVDLVIDVTADLSVQHYLSDLAREHRTAYIRAEALPGVRSGLVALQRPEAEVCWMCWQHHLASSIDPLPDHGPAEGVQPPGCPDPTYTGAGFDLAAIAAQTAQVAASYLTGPDGYGHLPADVMTVRFVADDGTPVPAQWQSHELERHAECRNHPAHPAPQNQAPGETEDATDPAPAGGAEGGVEEARVDAEAIEVSLPPASAGSV